MNFLEQTSIGRRKPLPSILFEDGDFQPTEFTSKYWPFTLWTTVNAPFLTNQNIADVFSYFPSNTSSQIFISFETPPASMPLPALVTARDQLLEIIRYLGLSKTQLKDVCKVSRQTLYDWLNEKFFPEKSKARRLRVLYELASYLRQNRYPAIRPMLLEHSLQRGRTFLSALREESLDPKSLREIALNLSLLSKKSEESSARALRKRLGLSDLDERTEEQNLNTADLAVDRE